MKYRKKAIVIEAHRWFKNGDHPGDYLSARTATVGGELETLPGLYFKGKNYEGEVVRYFRRPDMPGDRRCAHCQRVMNDHGWIDTLEGGHIVCPGDFIIKGVKGELYPCKPDIFDATYEAVT